MTTEPINRYIVELRVNNHKSPDQNISIAVIDVDADGYMAEDATPLVVEILNPNHSKHEALIEEIFDQIEELPEGDAILAVGFWSTATDYLDIPAELLFDEASYEWWESVGLGNLWQEHHNYLKSLGGDQ